MPTFGKRVDGPQGRRRASRKPTLLCVGARTMAGSYSVMVTDVSATGAKLRGRNLPPVGSELLLTVGTAQHLARIAWSEKEKCGILFDNALSGPEIDYLKSEGSLSALMGSAA